VGDWTHDAASHQPEPLETRMAIAAHDDVVMHHDTPRLCHGNDLARHGDVGLARRRIDGGMVVDQHDGRGGQFQRPAHDLARIDRRMVDRADLRHLIGDQGVLLVEKQDAELLARLEGHGGAARIDHRRPASQHGTPRHLPPCKALAGARRLGQQILRRGNHFGEGSESAYQLLRNRLNVAPRDRAEQHQFEQFVIGQRISPAVRKRSRSRSRCPI